MGVHLNSSVLKFGEFELDVRNHRLRRSGSELKLERIPMELLILLASRPGELVRREEIIQELWGDEINVDSENAINTAIRKIRQVLGDDSSSPRFVQTISKRGYRFLPETAEPAAPTEAPASTPKTTLSKTILWTLLTGIAVLFVVGLAVWSLRHSRKVLQVSNYMAITHDGLPKQGPLLSDGVRIYFVSGSMNHRSISQISVNGGEASTLVSALQSPRLLDISSGGSELLAASFGPDPGASMGEKAGLNESALWSISLPSGNVRRIGDLFADAAAFAPNGQKIAIGWNNALYVVNTDGTDQRKIALLSGTASSIRWSPDGKRLRLTIMDPKTLRSSLWESLKDGTSLHEILSGWNPVPAECCGRWSPDDRWYVFQSTRDGRTDLWALPES